MNCYRTHRFLRYELFHNKFIFKSYAEMQEIQQNRTQESMTIDKSLWNRYEKDNRRQLRAGQTPERLQQKVYRSKVCVKLLLSLWTHLHGKSCFLKEQHQK